MKKKHNRLLVMVLGTVMTMLTVPAVAQVIINGQLVEGLQLQALQLALGDVIPSGNYWLDASGNWGYAGNSDVQGNLYEVDGSSASGNGGSGSSYYSQGGAGGYGSYASDGECSIMSIEGMSVTSGNC
ncbi:MAG: hypothetical protein U9R74_09545 [Pseudomonadota bacterium]|nr:hypothetical protein [Pseudomonadota bacterium]